MSVIYVLLAISIAVAILFFIAFIVSVKQGQYDDSYTPSVRMLFEDELVIEKPSEEKQKSSLRGTKQTVESKQTDCRAALAMTNNKIQLNKQE
ncbi:cbb3-type cytochrome oxidase assembly protein CcoS [Maribacter sp. 2308TA10-17]|uniref:cbb3-type cytochrome oxidase assembly protein CcoS n=1 Tax=Maribacter sp. 2308TA10-17 TaxID=3386276 RepID=UPI0039BC6C37